MRKFLLFAVGCLLLASCGGERRVTESPMEFLIQVTLDDTMEYCMNVNGNRNYCECEIESLRNNFPWDVYMAQIDHLAGEQDHVAHVIARLNGNRRLILEELNCETCHFTVALEVIEVSPTPECVAILIMEEGIEFFQ